MRVRHALLGAFSALALTAVAACGGANPSTNYPAPINVGAAPSVPPGGATITMPSASGLATGTVSVSGSGSVTATQSTSPSSSTPVLSIAQRASAQRMQSGAAPSAVAYVTLTATAASTVTQVQVSVAPVPAVSGGSYYLALWNGSQWIPVGSPATVSNGVIKVNSSTLNPTVSLAAGSSLYLAVYTGSVLPTPSPAPGAPVPSLTALAIAQGQQATITVTSTTGGAITAASSNTSVATVSPGSQTLSNDTASFTIAAPVTNTTATTATITFADAQGRTSEVSVTVEPPTISTGDVVPVLVSASSGTSITVTSQNLAVAGVSSSATGTPSASVSVTAANGTATFYLIGVAGGYTTVALTDHSGDLGSMNVTVSAITNGSFTASNSMNGWSPCSYAWAAKTAPTNPASPIPSTPEPAQTGAPGSTPVPLASISPLVSVTAPPANDNPGWSNYTSSSVTPNTGSVTFMQNGTSETVTTPGGAPSTLGSNVMLLGSIAASPNPYPKGEFGVCQTFTVPTPPPSPSQSGPYLSFYVLEGGSEYSFKYADNEAAIFGSYSSNVASSLDEYLFTEENCYLHPSSAAPAGIWGGTGVNTDSGCWPSTYGGDTGTAGNPYYNWLLGGFWQQRGPYDLSSYAGKTVTLFLGNYSYYHDSASYYAQFMYVGNVQTTFSSAFPSTAPLARGRSISIDLQPKAKTALP
jgi:hypothetical protein